jgi:hypothetical protein
MSLQMKTYLRGVFHNIIFYERKGKSFAKAKASKVNRSVATKIRSTNLGFCSTLTKALRLGLVPHVDLLSSKTVQNRFNGCFIKWLGLQDPALKPAATQLPFINGFNFNEAAGIAERWKLSFAVMPVSDHLLELHIPAFVPTQLITAPAHTQQIICSISAASTAFLAPQQEAGSHAQWIIPYTNELMAARIIPLALPVAAGYLCITTMRLQYELSNGKSCNKPAFMPCSVIDARYRPL